MMARLRHLLLLAIAAAQLAPALGAADSSGWLELMRLMRQRTSGDTKNRINEPFQLSLTSSSAESNDDNSSDTSDSIVWSRPNLAQVLPSWSSDCASLERMRSKGLIDKHALVDSMYPGIVGTVAKLRCNNSRMIKLEGSDVNSMYQYYTREEGDHVELQCDESDAITTSRVRCVRRSTCNLQLPYGLRVEYRSPRLNDGAHGMKRAYFYCVAGGQPYPKKKYYCTGSKLYAHSDGQVFPVNVPICYNRYGYGDIVAGDDRHIHRQSHSEINTGSGSLVLGTGLVLFVICALVVLRLRKYRVRREQHAQAYTRHREAIADRLRDGLYSLHGATQRSVVELYTSSQLERMFRRERERQLREETRREQDEAALQEHLAIPPPAYDVALTMPKTEEEAQIRRTSDMVQQSGEDASGTAAAETSSHVNEALDDDENDADRNSAALDDAVSSDNRANLV